MTKASKQVLKQVPVGGNPRRVQAQIDRTLNEMKRLYMSTYLDQYEYVMFVIVALVFIFTHLLTSLPRAAPVDSDEAQALQPRHQGGQAADG